jgi:carbon storage regulator
MLVLSRRPGERIVLPGLNITIQVISIKSGAVRLGIEAPADIPILREELAVSHVDGRTTTLSPCLVRA